jgi:hypothetical protein
VVIRPAHAVAHTSIAGESTETPKFKNYSAQYSAVSKTDLLPKMRTALRKTNFKSPVTKEDMSTPRGKDRRYYTDEVTCSELENVGEAQNENLGRDLAPMEAGMASSRGNGGVTEVDGTLTFKKNPIIYVPQLDDTAVYTAATNPIYQIDHAVFCSVPEGDFCGRPAGTNPQQHNMWRTFIDLTYNFICANRRRCAVLRSI